jgi:hypothetical protein
VFVSNTVITPRQLVATARLTDPAGWSQLAVHGKGKVALLLALSNKPFPEPPVGAAEDGTAPESQPAVTTVHGGNAVAEFMGVAKVMGGVKPLTPLSATMAPKAALQWSTLSPEGFEPPASIARTSLPGVCEWLPAGW